jgi:hypothetical protein
VCNPWCHCFAALFVATDICLAGANMSAAPAPELTTEEYEILDAALSGAGGLEVVYVWQFAEPATSLVDRYSVEDGLAFATDVPRDVVLATLQAAPVEIDISALNALVKRRYEPSAMSC